MTLVLQIVVLLVVLVGLATIIMSIKNWHWAQMLLVLSIFFTTIGVLILGLEVFRIHRNIRSKIPALEQRIADVEAASEALLHGTRDQTLVSRIFPEEPPFDFEAEGRMPSMGAWTQRLRTQARERGRVWRNVKPTAAMDANGRIPLAIQQPTPHGLAEGAIVYAFEQGPVNPGQPEQGAQYLGEFRVVQSAENGVTLEPTQRLDEQAASRIQGSIQTALSQPAAVWSLYELMPADRHERFAGLSTERLQQLLPAASVDEYVRHGQPASPDDEEFEKAGFDDQGRRVSPENAGQAVETRYDRPLRDYAFLFAKLLGERVAMLTGIEGLRVDIARLTAAEESAQRLKAQRTEQVANLTADLNHMQRDRQFIENLLTTIRQQVDALRRRVGELAQTNAQLGRDLIQLQLSRLEQIKARPVSASAQ